MTQQNSQTVMITGAAGFIGSHLTGRLLRHGVQVVGLDNFNGFYDPALKRRNLQEAQSQDGFTLIEADVRDREAVMHALKSTRPGAVVHLAAMAGVRPSIENPRYYGQVNLDGTINLLDAAVAHGVGKFVFASSSSVYGNNKKVPFAEDDPVDHPISPYAATKKSGELLCHTYHHLHGLPVVCLRFFTVFGPRQRPDLAIAKFLRLVSAGRPVPMFGDGGTSRDYTYIDDIIDGVTGALSKCGSGEIPAYRIYNLGGSDPVSLRRMIDTIGQVVGKPARVQRQPMQPGDVDHTFADVSRSKAELGYRPQTPFAEGVSRQWQWLCQNS